MTEICIHSLWKGYTAKDRRELGLIGLEKNKALTYDFIFGAYDRDMIPYEERTKEYVFDYFRQLLEAEEQAKIKC